MRDLDEGASQLEILGGHHAPASPDASLRTSGGEACLGSIKMLGRVSSPLNFCRTLLHLLDRQGCARRRHHLLHWRIGSLSNKKE
jgi:hypothetical protein